MDFKATNNFSELIALLKCKRSRDGAAISYDQLAKRLGFQSPRTLAMVLKCQRAPSAALVQSVCAHLQVTAREREFILLLAEKSRRQVAGKSWAAIDERIEKFQAIQSLTIDEGAPVAGISVEISPSASESVRKRLYELLREFAFEFGQNSRPEMK